MPGTIFRLPDQMSLQRGITFTILPDGRSLRVPAMNRLDVRAQSQSHEEDGSHDMMQALQNILQGKKPVRGKARFNNRGRAHGNRVIHRNVRGNPLAMDPGEGLRQMEGGLALEEM